ncbi:MAG: AraC family transcriptional regulator [Verrucomicrobia subdivision 3 bacterium]|nr:AraC family transcriptional regulator [Limisphaerales bacterium]
MKINNAVPELTDVTVHASGTLTQGVKGPGVELRPWIAHFPVCPALTQHQIAHVGIMRTTAPTRIVRTKQTTTYFLACFGGRGNVLIDGRWRRCRAGFASLLPAHTLNAFEALPGVKWEFCWACYQQPLRPVADVSSPVMARYDALPLRSAITGLTQECKTAAEPTMIQHWADLIHNYVRRFAQPFQEDDRLRTLWERVVRHLGDPWSLARLAQEAGYSNEHLRRLCRHQLGRSPMHQVTHLRMRRAAELLASTSQTIEAIADQVGYHNPFVFSNAFTKWIGWRPSEYRRKKLTTEP